MEDDEIRGAERRCAKETSSERRRALSSIIEDLKVQKNLKDKVVPFLDEMQIVKEELTPAFCTGDTSAETLSESPTTPISKPRRRRIDRVANNGATLTATAATSPTDYHNNNNNHVKNERLSPSTPDTSSRSVTPSSASHPDTPPAQESSNPMLHLSGRNYSDFMRSLAAKYNNTNPNEYFARNGFPPPLDPRFKPGGFPLLPTLPPANKDDLSKKPSDFPSILNPFTASSMFPPLIDMSTTQTLLAMVRTAKEAELQGLLKNAKRSDTSSPLDLSAAAPPPPKRPRIKTPSIGSLCAPKRAESESPKLLHEDISHWSVDDVCNFVQGIDICAEYAQNFKEQRIDGSGLPLLTEEHLTTTMNMKLGPALKLKSVLAKKLGSCSVCLHCTHCHGNNGNSPESSSGHVAGNGSDSGGGNT